jgi:midasin (ATPase involved in ribosome maturation)
VILDTVKKEEDSKKKGGDGSIMSMKSAEKTESGIKLVPYLKDFPFEYYCIVRDI